MPSRYRIKQYIADGYYHLYNRGVEKHPIFHDAQDYSVFLRYLKIYLLPKDIELLTATLADRTIPWKQKDEVIKLLRLNNFSDSLKLLSYCLMPNHFHFLVKQTSADTIDRFMNSLCTRYTMYVNKKYHRVGPLFQSVYHAVFIENDEQLMYLTRYIHRNPLPLLHIEPKGSVSVLLDYPYSSYGRYIGRTHEDWIFCDEALALIGKHIGYQQFVEENTYEESMVGAISSVILDEFSEVPIDSDEIIL